MAAAKHIYVPQRAIDANGISDGASIYIYQAGTTTPVTLYSDEALSTERANPVVVPAGAEVPVFFYDDTQAVRRYIEYGDGTVDDEATYDPFIKKSDADAKPQAYTTNATVEAARVSSSLARTTGRAAAGDGGAADYRRAEAAIAHDNKLIDAAGNELEYEGETFKLEHICTPNTLTDQSDSLRKVLDHIDNRGAGILEISRGNYFYITQQIELPGNIMIRGPGGFNRQDPGSSGTAFDKATGIGGFVFGDNAGTFPKSMFKPTGRRTIFQGVDFFGNGAEAVERSGGVPLAAVDVPDLGHCIELPSTGNTGYDFTARDCRFTQFNAAIDNSDAVSGMRLYNNVFVQNTWGVYNAVDSMMGFNNFAGMRRNALNLFGGQWLLFGGLIEFTSWQDKSDADAAIYLGGNANEGTIMGVVFDRNGGYDIRAEDTSGNRPTLITIADNQFKRSAWTPAYTASNSRCLNLDGIDGLTLTGNMVQSSDGRPSGLQGARSPISFANITDCHGIIERDNNFHSLQGPALDLNGPDFDWYETTTSGEYALIRTGYPQTNDPNIYEPDTVYVNNSVQGAAGTVGSLAANKWGYGSVTVLAADSATGSDETFDTIIVQHSADPSAIDVSALWTIKPVTFGSGCTNIQTTGCRDRSPARFTINATSTLTKTLYTRAANASADSEAYVLRIRTRDGANRAFADFPFVVDLAGTTFGPTITEGAVDVRAGSRTFGWAGATTDIEVSIKARGVGSYLEVSVENTTGTNIGAELILLS